MAMHLCKKNGEKLIYEDFHNDHTWCETIIMICWRNALAEIQGTQNGLRAPDDYNTEYHLAQSDCLAADRQGQENTGLTLTPSVIPNSMLPW
jgi:hypothetical protein